jgi:uncharacterized protein (TIGR02145 family)
MSKTKGFVLAASTVLAMAFTFSCSSDDEGGDTPSSSSVGTQGGGVSSSSGGGQGGGGSDCPVDFGSITIGSQVWAKKNLNCDVQGSKCYDNDPANCTTYGRLYNWNTAKTACPKGWHLPSDAEWNVLMTAVGGSRTAGTKLKSMDGWNEDGNGTDEYGFSALPGGSGDSDGSFSSVGDNGRWWSSSEVYASIAYGRIMRYYYSGVGGGNSYKSDLYSVRCLQD